MNTAADVDHSRQELERLAELGVFQKLQEATDGLSGETAQAYRILNLLRQVVKSIPLITSEVVVQDHNKYEYMAHNLSTILGFKNFSLAEYVFMQPEGHKPGMRFWLYRKQSKLYLAVILFPQIGDWQVDEEGRMLRTELMHLDLSGAEPKVTDSVLEGVNTKTPWYEALALALCAPLG